ncbi:uncharacterized protein LOC110881488 [Helianthus annuus]|uniref:uncharacterized protein LOC110881488 n=1 Tax=Helianthus annuus TaxID=4232 RepID=UPI000B901354|nr:uncharacterized protein LOC110881488 [Helianthus annuus]
MADYFGEDPKYNDDIFRHRFLMSKRLFLKIVSDVEENDSWFQEALDARGRKGFMPLQKVTSAIKQLVTSNTPDENDEYLHMADRTSRECLEYFCDTVCKIYVPEFLRRPTSHGMELLYEAHEEKHHIPGRLKPSGFRTGLPCWNDIVTTWANSRTHRWGSQHLNRFITHAPRSSYED